MVKSSSSSNRKIAAGAKKFTASEIVILLIITVLNDALSIIADLSLAIPILGEVLIVSAEVADFVVFAVVLIWFGLKVGLLNAAGFVQMIGGVADFIGVPGRTVSAAIGMFIVNHPKLEGVATKIANPEAAVASKTASGITKSAV